MLAQPAALLLVAFSAGLWPCLVSGQPRELHPITENIVWRADNVTPDVVRRRRGFWPRGVNDGNAPTDVHGPPLVSPDISLYNHTMGVSAASASDSGYVSTTVEFLRARDYLWRYHRVPGYLYEIHATPNFIDVALTLGRHYHYRLEREFAALGGILFSQVRGWRHVLPDPNNPEHVLVSNYVWNPDYDHIFDDFGGGGAQYQLAGFPPGHEGLREAPWNNLGGCGRRRHKRNTDAECAGGTLPAKDAATRYMSSILKIDRVTLLVWLSDDLFSGTADTVSLQIGMSKPVTLFRDAGRGGKATVSVAVQELFDKPTVPLSDLSRITVIQNPGNHILMSDDFQIGGVRLEAHTAVFNQSLECTKFESVNRWFKDVSVKPALHAVGDVHVEDWHWVA